MHADRAVRRRFSSLLGLALLVSPLEAHESASPASPGGPGEVVARLPWGRGPDAIGGGPDASTGDAAVEGVPASFLVDESGSLHVLDTLNHRIVVLKPGAAPAIVSLSALGESAQLVDFARRGTGWLVADRTANQVVEIAADGTAGARWSGFQRVGRVDLAPGGTARALVRDDLALSVSRLADGGKVEEVAKSPHAVPVASGAGAWLARVALTRIAVWAPSETGATASLAAHASGDEVQGVEVAGTDAQGQLILAISEGKGDDRRGVWLTRLSAEGEVVAEVLAVPVDERWTSVPRFFRATPDGRVLSFRASETAYELVRYTLAPPAAPRRATASPKGADADARARAAICAATDSAGARSGLEAAALAAAFDETACARVEAELAALEAGAPPAALCALSQAREALDSGDAAKAKAVLAPIDHPGVRDRKLHLEAQALEKEGDLREALRRYQRIVLDHTDSPHFADAQAQVLRIIDSGKLPGAQPR